MLKATIRARGSLAVSLSNLRLYSEDSRRRAKSWDLGNKENEKLDESTAKRKTAAGSPTTKTDHDPSGIFLNGRPDVPLNWRKMETLPEWKRQKFALKEKFHGKGKWNPGKKVSRKAMEDIRYIKALAPELTLSEIASEYKISPEAVRRILASKWQPTEEQAQRLEERWRNRGDRIREAKGLPPINRHQLTPTMARSSSASASQSTSTSASASTPKTKKPKKRTKKRDLGDIYF